MRYLLTGDAFSAHEAFRIGQVQEVVEPGQQLVRAEEIAQTVAAQAPLGVRATLALARLAFTEGEEAAVKRLIPDLRLSCTVRISRRGDRRSLNGARLTFKGRRPSRRK
jgi:enoyl-CoA hydratase